MRLTFLRAKNKKESMRRMVELKGLSLSLIGLNWLQIRELVHGIVKKGRVVGFDLVEISPSFEKGNTTMIHAERLICNLIGAMVRAGYYDSQ